MRSTKNAPPARNETSKIKHAAKLMSIKAAVITVPAGDSLSSPKISVMYQLRLDEVMVRPMEPWYWRPSGSVHVPPR